MDIPAVIASSHSSIDEVPAAAWNALELGGVPFLRHEFLAALEHAGCVGPGTGWTPCHVTVMHGTELVGAMPLYRKTHSWGEFVFDFSWAQAYARHGERYYPKLVSATPFTPATGPRLLLRAATTGDAKPPGATALASADAVRRALLGAAQAGEPQASSLHLQFATAEEARWLTAHGALARIDCQFHWENSRPTADGATTRYLDFEDFLAGFTAEKRKKARRERRRVLEAGIGFAWCSGAELDAAEWQSVYALHADTFHRHGHEPYLSLAFFTELSRTLPGALEVLRARRGRSVVATAIFFRGADALYGRYWGASGDFNSLHFETCYHQGIEYCIGTGLARFEPGTQGEHKLARGFRPTLTHSAHFIREPRFAAAIGRFLEEERAAVRAYALAAGEHVPFRSDVMAPLRLESPAP